MPTFSLKKEIKDLPPAEVLLSTVDKDMASYHISLTTTIANENSLIEKGPIFITSKDRSMHMVRKNTVGIVKEVSDYTLQHLNNVVIKSLGIESPNTAIKQSEFVLYYYWFYRYHKSIDKIKPEPVKGYVFRNMCITIEEILGLIISKENTVYRENNTMEMVHAYRYLLSKLKSLGSIQSINLRRT